MNRCVIMIRYDTGHVVRLSCTDVVGIEFGAPRDDAFGESVSVFEPSADPDSHDMIETTTETDTLPGWLMSNMGSPAVVVVADDEEEG